jgi:peptidoglycan/xylan/chitin deacetylase (PgdA/CDA1 family)
MRAKKGMKALCRALVPPVFAVWKGPGERAKRRRRVALTFDDGPTPLTNDYLDVLGRFGARATFFVVGELCEKHPELIDAVARGGHELAGHGYTHRRFTDLSRNELRNELSRTRALLPVQQARRALVRPPHGELSLGSAAVCASAGFTLVLWSRDSGDWCTEQACDVVHAFDEKLEPGSIVLLHEGQKWTLEALPEILATLERQGHELCTVGELLHD